MKARWWVFCVDFIWFWSLNQMHISGFLGRAAVRRGRAKTREQHLRQLGWRRDVAYLLRVVGGVTFNGGVRVDDLQRERIRWLSHGFHCRDALCFFRSTREVKQFWCRDYIFSSLLQAILMLWVFCCAPGPNVLRVDCNIYLLLSETFLGTFLFSHILKQFWCLECNSVPLGQFCFT